MLPVILTHVTKAQYHACDKCTSPDGESSARLDGSRPRRSDWSPSKYDQQHRGWSLCRRSKDTRNNRTEVESCRRGVYRAERWRARRSASEAAKAEEVRIGDVFAKRTQSF